MRKCINKVTIEGYLYQHSLAVKTVSNQQSANYGKEFINGSIDIAVDEEGLNIISVRYTYVTPTTNAGTANRTYTVLKSIIDGAGTWVANGKDGALKVKCDTSFALNDFYGQDDVLVSQLVQEGGFISVVNELGPEESRNTFNLDFLITNVSRVDADPENNIPADYCKVRGAGFNFRNAILPMTLTINNEQGMAYFEDLNASGTEPVFLKVWGRINNRTTRVERTEESAFGEARVNSYEKKLKEWIITGAAREAYDYGDEAVLTAADVQKAMQDREVLLADTKKRTDDYRASKSATPAAAPAATTPKVTGPVFNF